MQTSRVGISRTDAVFRILTCVADAPERTKGGNLAIRLCPFAGANREMRLFLKSGSGRHVIIVGGGVIGTSTAAALIDEGYQVSIVERNAIGEGCSSGNSGIIALSGCVPNAMPGVLSSIPGYLFANGGPLKLNGLYAPRMIPWLARMVSSTSPAAIDRISTAMAGISRQAKGAFIELATLAGTRDLVRETGTIYVYDTEAGFGAAKLGIELRRRHGVEMQELSRDEIKELEPDTTGVFYRGMLVPGNAYCANPERFVKSVGTYVRSRQGRVVKATVRGIQPSTQGVQVVTDEAGTLQADALVVAAGAWTKRLVEPLGVRLMIAPQRGYHVMLNGHRSTLRHPLLWVQRGFAIVPMEHGLRAAGTVEIDDADAAPNFRRAEQIGKHLRRAIASVDPKAGVQWMGVRPATPDTMPVIGAIPGHSNIIVAAGHGHLGLSLGPITGRAVADLIARRKPSFDVSAMRVDRFH